jgi:hypothetical protein
MHAAYLRLAETQYPAGNLCTRCGLIGNYRSCTVDGAGRCRRVVWKGSYVSGGKVVEASLVLGHEWAEGKGCDVVREG